MLLLCQLSQEHLEQVMVEYVHMHQDSSKNCDSEQQDTRHCMHDKSVPGFTHGHGFPG